jgi:SpoVK/Ycf46/Vps4 family AAA+-type ATPase
VNFVLNSSCFFISFLRALQALTLLEMIATENKPYQYELQNGIDLLKLCLSQLKEQQDGLFPSCSTVLPSSISSSSSSSIHHINGNHLIEEENSDKRSESKSDDDSVSSFPLEKYMISPDNNVVTFQDIIGCHKAKQSLQENVILQLRLSNEVLASTFQGIRAGTGNVLLFGPPGSGKTLLAQVRALPLVTSFSFLS